MKKHYVKSDSSYDKPSDFDEKKLAAAMKRSKKQRKIPTSIALDPDLVVEIKSAAESEGVPYQVLLRMFIIDGFKRWKKAG